MLLKLKCHNFYFFLCIISILIEITQLLFISEDNPGVRVIRSLVLYACHVVDRCLSFCTFSFGHCVVCSSMYGL